MNDDITGTEHDDGDSDAPIGEPMPGETISDRDMVAHPASTDRAATADDDDVELDAPSGNSDSPAGHGDLDPESPGASVLQDGPGDLVEPNEPA
jgi:hypothetical protein